MTVAALETALLSLAAATSWGGGDFAGGLASKRADVFRVVAVAHACGFVVTLLMAFVSREPFPPLVAMEWGAFAGFIGAFGIAALYRALAIGRMGVVAPVAAVVTGILPVLLGIRSDGLPHPTQLLGFGVALVSIWMVARPEESADSHRGAGLAVAAGISFGLFLVAGKQAGHHAVFWPLVAARLVSTLLMASIALTRPATGQRIRNLLWLMVLSGLLDSFGNALFVAATRSGRLDVAAVLSSLYPASTVVLARILLKEKIAPLQLVGIVGALSSVALISLP